MLDDDLGMFEGDVEADVTPIVNIALILVLVFMVTSPFIVKSLLPVNLPQAVTSKTERDQNITVSISPETGFAINEIPLIREAIPLELSRHIKRSGISYVLIRADERVPYGEVEDIVKLAKNLGASRIAFATMPKGRQ